MIPDSLVILDSNLQTSRTLTRIDGGELTEKAYDTLVATQLSVLADCLAKANLIDEDSTLRLIGTQIQRTDVLLLEVDSTLRPRRLVVVENKLARNRESRRTVLAQVLDYAEKLQFATSVEALVSVAPAETKELLRRESRELADILRRGTFLLLICGDRIQPDLLRLIQPFMNHERYVASRYTLGLLSLALYRDPSSVRRFSCPTWSEPSREVNVRSS